MTKASKKSKQTKEQTSERKRVSARSENQLKLINSIIDNHITLAIGPAGCGKTHISVGMAVKALFEKRVSKIIISRPIVTAGEDPGAIPGDIKQKLHPFLIPLYDELKCFVSETEIRHWFEQEILEIAPVAYMRGRTLKNAFIIVDEAQNCTYQQLKMVLTRYGEGSIMVINGDPEQSDLAQKTGGALIRAEKQLENLSGLGIVRLDETDIVRHAIVGKILERMD